MCFKPFLNYVWKLLGWCVAVLRVNLKVCEQTHQLYSITVFKTTLHFLKLFKRKLRRPSAVKLQFISTTSVSRGWRGNCPCLRTVLLTPFSLTWPVWSCPWCRGGLRETHQGCCCHTTCSTQAWDSWGHSAYRPAAFRDVDTRHH